MSSTAMLPRQHITALPVLATLALGLILLGALFYPEAAAAVATWNASTAYGHCYLVLPMALYLLWERREVLAGMVPRAEPGWALLALPITAAWLASERLGIMEGRQLAAIGAVELLFLVVLGRRVFQAMLGPLLYLVFLVPFGAFLTPFLQHFTARFAAIGLNLLGIPNFADDLVIEIPAGTFFVAEACAGLRFLIAAVAFGVFYALLNYRSPGRRAAFMLASIAVPIVANGFRALGIVVLGHILGSAEAAAADHVIYGWVFFSIVMLLLVAGGLPFREFPEAAAPMKADPVRPGAAPLWGVLAACLLVAAGPATARMFDSRAAQVPLTTLPKLALPNECRSVDETPPALPATRVTLHLMCEGLSLDAVIQTFPARSTAAALGAERRRLAGEFGAEDVSITPLPLTRADNGNWSLVQTYEPFRTSAVAVWVDGAPARGGLSGRLAQARDSVLGGDHAAVLMVIGTNLDARLAADRQRALQALLSRLVDGQDGLTAQMEALSRAPG